MVVIGVKCIIYVLIPKCKPYINTRATPPPGRGEDLVQSPYAAIFVFMFFLVSKSKHS